MTGAAYNLGAMDWLSSLSDLAKIGANTYGQVLQIKTNSKISKATLQAQLDQIRAGSGAALPASPVPASAVAQVTTAEGSFFERYKLPLGVAAVGALLYSMKGAK